MTKVVEGVVPGSAWAFTGELGAFNIAAGGGFNSFQDLADDTYTITETTKAGYEVSRECHLDSDASVIVAEAASNTVNVPISGGQAITCVFTNTIVGDFTVYKDFTDDLPSSVGVTLSCTSGTITTNPLQASEASEAIFEVKGYAAGTTCTAVESVPGGYQGNISDCQDDDPINTDCTLVNSPVPPSTIAIFRIHKVWNQEGDTNDIPVNAFLSCTGANTTQIPVTFTATTDAILYVYDIGKAEGPVDCTITETVPANYTADYEVGVCAAAECLDSPTIAACKYIDVADEGNSLCVITNTPDPATIEVDKTWVIEGADQGFDGDYEIWLYCDSEVTGPGSEFSYYGTWYANYYANADDGHKNLTFTVVKPNYPYTGCYVYEENDDSVVETSNSCADDELELGAGGEASCDIVNTVFFEGIPTLNQYGMAILALLMLGVGFVGLRRFV